MYVRRPHTLLVKVTPLQTPPTRKDGLLHDYDSIRGRFPHLCSALTDKEYELAAILNDVSYSGLHPTAGEDKKDTNITHNVKVVTLDVPNTCVWKTMNHPPGRFFKKTADK